jgi:dTDP-4-amino-4,6-dideoxygalactose transaminase
LRPSTTRASRELSIAIKALDLEAEYALLRGEIEPAVERVLASGRYIGGPEVEGLEAEFAPVCGVPHAVSISSGTDALRFALIAAGVGSGDEVITTPFTFIGTTEAISQAGARPVFADIEPSTFTLDPARVEAAITRRTRALLPVDLYGQPADLPALEEIARRRGLKLIEDACQAHGAQLHGKPAGGFGQAAAFSFYPSKNLGAFGEGGMVTTSDLGLSERVRRLSDHGQTTKYVHAEEGYNGRLDALQAAILRVKLRRLPEWNETRRRLASLYGERLAGLASRGLLRLPVERPGARHVYHLFAVRIPAAGGERKGGTLSPRDRVHAALREAGIEAGVHYPIPLHRQPCYADLGLKEGTFPVSEQAAREILTLPLHPLLTAGQIDQVCDALGRLLA